VAGVLRQDEVVGFELLRNLFPILRQAKASRGVRTRNDVVEHILPLAKEEIAVGVERVVNSAAVHRNILLRGVAAH
jgi:aminopeptidase-like protein